MAAITAAILLGLGLAAAGERGRPALDLFQSLLEGVMRIVGWILWLLPIGLFFFVTAVVAKIGLENIAKPVLGYMGVALAALAIHALLVLPLYCKVFGGGNGWTLLWNLRRVFLTAFSTSSTCVSPTSVKTKLNFNRLPSAPGPSSRTDIESRNCSTDVLRSSPTARRGSSALPWMPLRSS
jgi:Na+/H+-dicarboxylate symporter